MAYFSITEIYCPVCMNVWGSHIAPPGKAQMVAKTCEKCKFEEADNKYGDIKVQKM